MATASRVPALTPHGLDKGGRVKSLNDLRQLADQHQFALLQANAGLCWDETDDPAALPLLALACAQLGDRAGAEAALAQLAALNPDLDLDARVDLAAAHILTGRLVEAGTALENAVAENPNHPLALARLAFCRMQAGALDEARTLYQRAASLTPRRLPVWAALVRLQLEAADFGAAQRALDNGLASLASQQDHLAEATAGELATQFHGLQLEIWVATDNLPEAELWLEAQRDQLEAAKWAGFVVGYAALLAGRGQHAAAEEALRGALKHTPDNLSLISQLAELAQLQGRTIQAIRLLHRLIALAKQQETPQAGFWVRLSHACLHAFDEQARLAAEKAVELAGLMTESEATPAAMIAGLKWQAKNALAQVESQAQRFDQAETLFNEVLAENPWFLPALQGLGQQQMQLGRIDEAVELFERIKQIDPAKGYSSLIGVRRFPEDEATLTRMEKAARQPSLEGAVRSGLLLQLASAYEKRKEYDKAFALASEANAASKALLHYDPQAHRQRCARIRHAFCQALYEHRKDCGYRGEDASLPVFVLGMPRSGTTLVEQILAGHSQIFGAGELGIIPQRIQGLNRWERQVGSGREYPDCIDDLNPYITDGIAKGILTELKELAADDKPEARFVVDKLPHNFENIGLIKFLFPQARIISVRRDPRDIALSNYFTDYQAKHGGMGFAYDLGWIGEQLADHNLLMLHWQQCFPGEILEIHYEDVVEDTEREARKMLDYIGVEWEPQVLAFNELERTVKTASVWQVRQPIYKTSKAKWERYRNHLGPLIAGTNAKITWELIEMVTLPTPGMFTDGVALYKDGKLDEAEYAFKKLLHHLPEHAAANHTLGIIYARKAHIEDAIELMEKAHERYPWNPEWRADLIQAYELAGQPHKAAALMRKNRAAPPVTTAGTDWSDGPSPLDPADTEPRFYASDTRPAYARQPGLRPG